MVKEIFVFLVGLVNELIKKLGKIIGLVERNIGNSKLLVLNLINKRRKL